MTTMLAAWSVTYLVHSTILIALVAVAARFLRSASARDTLWKVALLGGIVTATLQMAAPVERVVPQSAPRRITMQMPAPAAPAETVDQRMTVAAAPAPAARPSRRIPAMPAIPLLWAAATALLVARIVIGRRRFLAAIGGRVELLRGPERALLDRLAASVGVARPIRLSESEGVRSPVAMLGWEIVIPAGVFAALSGEQRETILAHEIAHLTRRDPLWLTVCEAVKALLCFQPLNWLVQARLKETAEFLCDDAAVLQTGNRKALAETLAELATRVTAAVPAVAAMAEGGSNLIVRVGRVLRSHGLPDLPLRLRFRLTMALLIVALTAVFAPGMTIVRASTRAAVTAAADSPTLRVDGTVLATTVWAKTAPDQPRKQLECRFTDGVLERSFVGPEGKTRVHLQARNATVANDGSYISFDGRGGYLHARQTAEHGPAREVDVAPGRDGREPVYRYTVDGREQPWSDEARRTIAAAFSAQDAYADVKPRRTAATEHPAAADGKVHTWNATIELTGSTDGVPTHIGIRAISIRYTESGQLLLDAGSSLHVEQTTGSSKRTFDLTATQRLFHSNDGSSAEQQVEWLRDVLRKDAKLPRAVIEAIAHSSS